MKSKSGKSTKTRKGKTGKDKRRHDVDEVFTRSSDEEGMI